MEYKLCILQLFIMKYRLMKPKWFILLHQREGSGASLGDGTGYVLLCVTYFQRILRRVVIVSSNNRSMSSEQNSGFEPYKAKTIPISLITIQIASATIRHWNYKVLSWPLTIYLKNDIYLRYFNLRQSLVIYHCGSMVGKPQIKHHSVRHRRQQIMVKKTNQLSSWLWSTKFIWLFY